MRTRLKKIRIFLEKYTKIGVRLSSLMWYSRYKSEQMFVFFPKKWQCGVAFLGIGGIMSALSGGKYGLSLWRRGFFTPTGFRMTGRVEFRMTGRENGRYDEKGAAE